MSGKAGEHVAATNKEQKHEMGKSANACANKFLAGLRGDLVQVWHQGNIIAEGELKEFDLYALVISGNGAQRLVFKGPGVTVVAL